MSQKSSDPQAISFVSQPLKRDNATKDISDKGVELVIFHCREDIGEGKKQNAT